VFPLLSRHVGFPLADRLMGTRVVQRLHQFEAIQWWPASELAALQNEKLARLVHHAYDTVPYYRDVMRQRKLTPEDIRTTDDLHKMPILTRELAQRENDRLRSSEANRYGPLPRQTSGSTRQPLAFLIDREAKSAGLAALYQSMMWAGYSMGERFAVLWGGPVRATLGQRVRTRAGQWLLNKMFLNAFDLSEQTLRRHVERLHAWRPVILRGYVSALVRLAHYLRDHQLAGIRPRAVSTTAEVLHEPERALLQEQFGCPVFDQYGCREALGIAAECSEHAGMHIFAQRAVVEVVREDEPAAPAVEGRLVLTDLDNYAMPFIRYANGDCASTIANACPCGRSLPLMDRVLGRAFDIIRGPSGRTAHSALFGGCMMDLGWYERFGIRQFQAVQTSDTELVIDVVAADPVPPQAIGELRSHLQDYLGDMKISVKLCESINPRPSGKRRAIRSDIS
jgi:phenylacetate-CoA ligase